MPMKNRAWHNAIEGKKSIYEMGKFQRWWYGTPAWAKAGEGYGIGRGIRSLNPKGAECGCD